MQTPEVSPSRRVMRRSSAADRNSYLGQFKSSGLAQREFCARNGLNPTTFSGWLRRERQRAPAGFAEVSLQVRAEEPVEIELPCGVRIRAGTSGDLRRTAELVRRVVGMEGGPC